MKKCKAVFFDAGGTLFRPYPSVGHIYATAAKTYGADCDPEILELAFYESWKKRGGLSSLGRETSEAKEKHWWRTLVTEVFESHGRHVSRFDDFFEALHKSFEEKHLWEIFPEVPGVLQELRKRSITIGIVSNWDLRLEKLLRNLGLDSQIDFWVSSSVCGATKPDAKIFKAALERSKSLPNETLHVGDTFEEDVIGAQGVGIEALLIDRSERLEEIPNEIKIKSLSEILDRI